MVSKWVISYNLLINGVYWGYNPLTNLLLTSWDIQAGSSNLIHHKKHNVAFSREEPSIMALKVFCGGMALFDGEGLKHIFFVTWNIESVRVGTPING